MHQVHELITAENLTDKYQYAEKSEIKISS